MEKQDIIDMLNKDRANELIAILQYMNHHYQVTGKDFLQLQDLFKELGLVEMQHAEQLAERISVLGGEPVSRTDALKKFTDLNVTETQNPEEMVSSNLNYEQMAIDDYSEHIKKIADNDPVTVTLLTDILAQEEEHANDLASWMGEQDIPFNQKAVGAP